MASEVANLNQKNLNFYKVVNEWRLSQQRSPGRAKTILTDEG
jgi:hypothetical protein